MKKLIGFCTIMLLFGSVDSFGMDPHGTKKEEMNAHEIRKEIKRLKALQRSGHFGRKSFKEEQALKEKAAKAGITIPQIARKYGKGKQKKRRK